MQLVDLRSETANTSTNYELYSQMEIVREMKEDFLNVSDEPLSSKASEIGRMANYELPDGSTVQMSSYERQSITEKLFQNQSSL